MNTKNNDIKEVIPPAALTSFGRNKILYISGPITNHSDYIERFEAAEERLRSMGFQPINPAKVLLLLPTTLTYDQMMYMCYTMLDLSDGIYMLQGWMDSKGAKLELEYAFQKGKPEFYEEYE